MIFVEYFDSTINDESKVDSPVINKVEDLLLDGVQFPVNLLFTTEEGTYVLEVHTKPIKSFYGSVILNASVIKSTDPDLFVGSIINFPFSKGIDVTTIEGSKLEEFSNPDKLNSVEYFSLREDLKLAKLPPKMRYMRFIKDYKRYISQIKNKITDEDIKYINQLLLLNFNAILNNLEELILSNRPIATALGIKDKLLSKALLNFQKEYRKLLVAKEKLGYIPKLNQTKMNPLYKDVIGFIQADVFESVKDRVNNI